MTTRLEANARELTGKAVDQLRQQSKIPAVLYGHGIKNQNLELEANTFEKIYKEAGESTLLDLSIGGAEPVKVLIAEVQYDSVSGHIAHIDFRQIKMDEKITAHAVVVFDGEAPAVKELEGVLIHSLSEIEIKCLPADLIHEIHVDVSGLKTFNDVVTVGELDIPENVEVVGHEKNDVVATVIPPKVEEEPVVAETAEGEEGEEGAEGEEGVEGEVKEGEEGAVPKEGEASGEQAQKPDEKQDGGKQDKK